MRMFLMVDTVRFCNGVFIRGGRVNYFKNGFEGIKHNVAPEVVKDQSQ